MKTEQVKNDLLNWKKLTLGKVARYASFAIGAGQVEIAIFANEDLKKAAERGQL